MTDRERLIELLNDSTNTQYEGDKIIKSELNVDDDDINYIADYLLENNVKPLPFKINDIVYGISREQIIPIQIDTIQYTSKGIDICGSNEEYFGYSTIHLDVNNQIGMEWYYTREEAENALKNMND